MNKLTVQITIPEQAPKNDLESEKSRGQEGSFSRRRRNIPAMKEMSLTELEVFGS